MNRHIRDDGGRLIQLDKKWKDLRIRQQEWIAEELRTRYLKAYDEAGSEPSRQVCDDILFQVTEMIEARGIWIPDGEVVRYFHKKKGRWLKKHLQRREEALSVLFSKTLGNQGPL